jgi:hypothetical protein
MKTQISRDSFAREQRYSGVQLQQGRMLLDADWNELSEIDRQRVVDALHDAIAGGSPREGGLRLIADPPGSTNVRIVPGSLYVDGVPARLDAAAPLAVDAQPDYPLHAGYDGRNVHLYADVWERCVSALEAPALLDPALHGADTATRSQTMLQIKWCSETRDPLDPAFNPPLGDAPLCVRLRLVAASGDACDPCASQVRVDERIGNYLFRVEVHDYDAATQTLTLKWSRDNGAEACAAAAPPVGFDQGDWVWEFYDADTERLLGNHPGVSPAPAKLRGVLKENCVAPTGAGEAKTWVRQWDGMLRIRLDSGACSGCDRGVALFAGADDDPAHGRVLYAGGVLKVNLERVELELRCVGQRFVAGDYWLATVREATQVSGQYVLPAMPDLSVPAHGEPPRGVRHHYLLLGQIDNDRHLRPASDALRRRLAFPPLSDIRAADVGFTDNCFGLFAGAQNVQQALDNLCAIGAEDIAYLLPDCAASEGRSLKDRLRAALDADGDGRLSVKAALDGLLCRLDATSLPYAVPACSATPSVRQRLGLAPGDANVAPVLDALLCEFNAGDLPLDKSDAALCSDLKVPAVVSVQDALGVLCARSGGGCAVVVSSPQHLGLLLDEFARSNADDLWLCLKAGHYVLDNLPAITGKRSLRLCGESARAVTISVSGPTLAFGAEQLILDQLALNFASNVGQLAINAAHVTLHGCRFKRTTTSAGGPAMLRIAGIGNAVCTLAVRDSVFTAQQRVVAGLSEPWASAEVVGNAQVSDALLALSREDVLSDSSAYDAALDTAVTSINRMTPQERAKWRVRLEQQLANSGRALATRTVEKNAQSMVDVLANAETNRSETKAAVEALLAEWVSYQPDYALRLANARVGGVIADCQVDGWLLLANGVSGYSVPTHNGSGGVALEGDAVTAGGEDLHLRANSFAAVRANVAAGAFNADAALVQRVAGYAHLQLADNSFADSGNSFVAASFVALGNCWNYDGDAQQRIGFAVADRASFAGNVLEDYTDNAHVLCSARASMIASSGNVLVELESTR